MFEKMAGFLNWIYYKTEPIRNYLFNLIMAY